MTKLVDSVIALAKSQVGVHEAKVNGHWNNDQKYSNEVPDLEWSDFQPWCATFVSWVAYKSGAGALYPRTASCDTAGAWFKSKGRWSEYPAIGAQVFYGVPRDLSHTGIVVAYDDIYVYTIEGNTNLSGAREGDGVYAKKRLRRDDYLIGYGYPDFPGGIKSADPLWASGHKAGAPVAPKPKPTIGQAARIDGIDLSHHNTGITLTGLKTAKAHGVRFVFHKATEGTGFTDVQYGTRRRLCAAAGIPFGAYHFARPATSSGTTQAKQYLAYAKLKPGDLLPVLDLEDMGGLSITKLTKWVGEFTAECKRQLGDHGGLIYTKFDLADSFGWHLWTARYNDAMSAPVVAHPWHSWYLWQFSNGVAGRPDTVPGIGACDINTLSWKPTGMAKKIRIPLPKPAPKPVPKPTPPPVVVPPPPPVVPPVPARARFRNVQCNVQQTDPLASASKHIRSVSVYGDVIGWNELGTAALQDVVRTLPGFMSAFGPGLASGAVAISWRPDVFTLEASGYIKVNSGVAGITPSRYILWVRLRHITSGVVFTRVNTHVVHHIEVAGLPRVVGALTGQNARAKKHFALLGGAIATALTYGPVVTGGDFNVDYLAEKALPPSQRCPWFPYTLLSVVAIPAMPDHGTHGGRAIDWTLVSGAVTTSSVRVLSHGSSDHNPVQAFIELT